MRPKKDSNKNDIDEILKKIESESAEEKKKQTMDLMRGSKPETKVQKTSSFKIIQDSMKDQWKTFMRRSRTE